jgi:hypothetical protein
MERKLITQNHPLPNPAAPVDAPRPVSLRWLRLGRRATEQASLGGLDHRI